MRPELRRAAIIDAALPLLRRHGADVTTKQIAEAAGVAEGTVFRAFADKESLIVAAVQQAFDPRETISLLRTVDLTRPLEERLTVAIDILIARLETVWELMTALRILGGPDQDPRFRAALPSQQVHDMLPEALMALIEPDRCQLRVDTSQAARILRLITFACTHPRITESNPLQPDEIVDLLLNGLRVHRPDGCAHAQPP
jgi:AcrR family transcriptional regulator